MNKSQESQINQVLKDCRKEINSLDNEIIKLLGKRFKIVRKVAKIKAKKGIPSFLSGRIIEVRERVMKLARKHRVDPDFVYGMYNSMIMHACLEEDELMAKDSNKGNKK